MEALLVTFPRLFHGLPYLVSCEDLHVSEGNAAWLRDYVLGDGPAVALAPAPGETDVLFHCLYADGCFLTEVTAALDPAAAAADPGLLERHALLRAGIPCALDFLGGLDAGGPPLLGGIAAMRAAAPAAPAPPEARRA